MEIQTRTAITRQPRELIRTPCCTLSSEIPSVHPDSTAVAGRGGSQRSTLVLVGSLSDNNDKQSHRSCDRQSTVLDALPCERYIRYHHLSVTDKEIEDREGCAYDHTANNWKSSDLNPGNVAPESRLLITALDVLPLKTERRKYSALFLFPRSSTGSGVAFLLRCLVTSLPARAKPSLQCPSEAQHYGVHHSRADLPVWRPACLAPRPHT